MDVYTAKCMVMALLGGISSLLGFIAFIFGGFFRRQDANQRNEAIFSSLLCFGGGVLINTSLVHILPEVRITY